MAVPTTTHKNAGRSLSQRPKWENRQARELLYLLPNAPFAFLSEKKTMAEIKKEVESSLELQAWGSW